MSEIEFTIDGRRFRAQKLNALQQWQLHRRLLPLIRPLVPLFGMLDEEKKLNADLGSFMALAEPFTDAMAAMSDDDAEQILTRTLSSVKLETAPGTWMPLWVGGGKQPIDSELDDLHKLVPIVFKVIQFNLEGFIRGFLTSHGEPPQTQSGAPSPAVTTS